MCAAAAEALTADANALKELFNLLYSPEEKAVVHISIIRGLSTNQAKGFPDHALPVIENSKEAVEVRAYAIEQLAKVLKRSHRDFPEHLRKRAKKVIGDLVEAKEKPLREAAIAYLKVEEQIAPDGGK